MAKLWLKLSTVAFVILTFTYLMETLVKYQVVYWATKVLVLSKKLAKGLKHLKKVTVYQSLGSSKDVVIVNTVQLVVKHSVVL